MNADRKGLVLGGFVGLLLAGALVWARSQDPFRRVEFSVRTDDGKMAGMVVLPKPARSCPVIVYVHGARGSLLTDGRELRQSAELGFAAVGFDYSQTNGAAFDRQFSALLEYVRQQPWARPDRIAWIGFSQGAQNTLSYLLKHPQARPQLLVRIGGGWVNELDLFNRKDRKELKDGGGLTTDKTERGKAATNMVEPGSPGRGTRPTESPRLVGPAPSPGGPNGSANYQTPTLLVHGERDDFFPASDARKLAAVLSSNDAPVDLKILPGMGHSLDQNRPAVIRVVGEYAKAHLMPEQPQPEFTRPPRYPFWVCVAPAFLWVGFWAAKKRKNRIKEAETPGQGTRPTRFEVGLRVAAVGLAILALGQTALHLVPPRMEVSTVTLRIARDRLIPAKWKEDFEVLAGLPIWKGQKLGTLLTQVELANYTVRELVNWKLDDAIYREFVLSPVIDPKLDTGLDWRRPLWEFFYPRIRREQTTEAAAQIVVRGLRERITIWPRDIRLVTSTATRNFRLVTSIWEQHITDAEGFELIYVAALRSVGVPARLDSRRQAEFWDTGQWQPVPRPPLSQWTDLQGPAK